MKEESVVDAMLLSNNILRLCTICILVVHTYHNIIMCALVLYSVADSTAFLRTISGDLFPGLCVGREKMAWHPDALTLRGEQCISTYKFEDFYYRITIIHSIWKEVD